MKTTFTAKELKEKGFELIEECETYYFQYVFDSSNFFNSQFLTTNDVTEEELNEEVFRVISGVYKEDANLLLTEKEIDLLIKEHTV